MRRFSLCLVIGSLVVSCGKESSSSEAKASTEANPSLMKKLELSEADVTAHTTILPSEIINKLKSEAADLEAFLDDSLMSVNNTMGVDALKEALINAYMLDTQKFFDGRSYDQIKKDERLEFVRGLSSYVADMPEPMNKFPTVSLHTIKAFQKISAAKGDEKAVFNDEAPFMPEGKAPQKLEFTLKGPLETCDTEKSEFSKVEFSDTEQDLVYTGDELIDQKIVSCYHQNSKELSEAVNVLANAISEKAQAITLNYKNGDEENNYAIHDINVLLAVLGESGLMGESFLKRGFVNFKSFLMQKGEEYSYMRSPLWIKQFAGSDVVMLPAEHADFGFMFFDKESENRIAGMRYFLGVPSSEQKSQVSSWKPYALKEAGWVRGSISNSVTYTSDELDMAADWFNASFETMWGYQKFQKREKLPFNGYGSSVCTDSVVLSYAKYLELSDKKDMEKRDFHTFIIARSSEADMDKKLMTDIGLDYTFVNKIFPNDFDLLEKTPVGFMDRIKDSVTENPARYRVFPEATVYTHIQ